MRSTSVTVTEDTSNIGTVLNLFVDEQHVGGVTRHEDGWAVRLPHGGEVTDRKDSAVNALAALAGHLNLSVTVAVWN